ncbi:MAG: ribonuclease Z [Bacteroidaceae bacterium]|nr:ribonuclease Z [Bacteroidaceae bacterium]
MEIFEVNILGCGSAKPTLRHLPSSQIVNIRGKYYMIDCGEGAQIQMQKMNIPMARVGHIFISHNHGDHVFGLPGLISTMALLGRTADLHIHGPRELQEYLDTIIQIYCEGITFQILFHPIDTRTHNIIYEDRSVTVWSIPLKHRIPCSGFLFRETPPLPHIRREMIDAFNIPFSQINNIKAGASWTTEDGTLIPNEKLVIPAEKSRSYAYCSDTAYLPHLAEILRDVTLLYHEATYPDELLKRAQETRHSTASQAATIAKESKVEKLCIGHFSARVKNEKDLLAEATAIFPQTRLAYEGLNIKL